jgi:hypothetical protein
MEQREFVRLVLEAYRSAPGTTGAVQIVFLQLNFMNAACL